MSTEPDPAVERPEAPRDCSRPSLDHAAMLLLLAAIKGAAEQLAPNDDDDLDES